MKVLITAHISAGSEFRFTVQLDALSIPLKCSCEIQSFAVEQVSAKVLASKNVFAAGLERTSYFLAMPAHRKPQPTSIEADEVFTCDVYCMILDSGSSGGMTRAELVSEFQSAFDELSQLSEGMVTPWDCSTSLDSNCSPYDVKKGFDGCMTLSGTHIYMNNVFVHVKVSCYST